MSSGQNLSREAEKGNVSPSYQSNSGSLCGFEPRTPGRRGPVPLLELVGAPLSGVLTSDGTYCVLSVSLSAL